MASPLILGIGGTPHMGSSTQRALEISLAAASEAGADTLLIGGPDLVLPMYMPNEPSRPPAAQRLVDAFRRADGLVIASPAYHGSISGLVKNALDYAEDLRSDERPYFDGRAVGLIVCAGGWQGAGQTLSAMRAIVHALRGWPTPMGAMLNTSQRVFDQSGTCLDDVARLQLETVGRQVVDFARMRSGVPVAGVPVSQD